MDHDNAHSSACKPSSQSPKLHHQSDMSEQGSRKRPRITSDDQASSSTLATSKEAPHDSIDHRTYQYLNESEGERFGLKLVFPQHTEKSYAQKVNDQTLAVVCTHEFFPRGRVRFNHMEDLGLGNFSIVDKVEPSGGKILPGRSYARKVFTLARQPARGTSSAEFERLDSAKSLHHPHVITAIMTYEEESFNLQSLRYGIIMSPIANCTLQVFLERVNSEKPTPFNPLPIAQKWLGCLASGLSYIHAKGLLHKDIRSSSIGVKNGDVFFTEFAISNYFKESSMLVQETSDGGGVKSYIYLAPEIILGQISSVKTDVFSLGCVYLEIMTAAAGLSLDTLRQSLNGVSQQLQAPNFTRAIEQLTEHQDRLQSAFLQQFIPSCQAMVQPDPCLRPSAFTIARSIYDLDEKVSKRMPKLDKCQCLLPWQGKDDEQCQLTLSSSKLTEILRSNLEPGTWELPYDTLLCQDNKNCSYCSEPTGNFMDTMFHLFARHPDLLHRKRNLVCEAAECTGKPAFQDEAGYADHQFEFHKIGLTWPRETCKD